MMDWTRFPFDASYTALVSLADRWQTDQPALALRRDTLWAAFRDWSQAVELLLVPLTSGGQGVVGYWGTNGEESRWTTDLAAWDTLWPSAQAFRGFLIVAPEPLPVELRAQWSRLWPARFGQWSRLAAIVWEMDCRLTEADPPTVHGHRRIWGTHVPDPWVSAFVADAGFGHWVTVSTTLREADPAQRPARPTDDWPHLMTDLLQHYEPHHAWTQAVQSVWRTTVPSQPGSKHPARAWIGWIGWGLWAATVAAWLWRG